MNATAVITTIIPTIIVTAVVAYKLHRRKVNAILNANDKLVNGERDAHQREISALHDAHLQQLEAIRENLSDRIGTLSTCVDRHEDHVRAAIDIMPLFGAMCVLISRHMRIDPDRLVNLMDVRFDQEYWEASFLFAPAGVIIPEHRLDVKILFKAGDCLKVWIENAGPPCRVSVPDALGNIPGEEWERLAAELVDAIDYTRPTPSSACA